MKAVKAFSEMINLKTIRIICLLGEGAFAKVFLIKKTDPKTKQSCYYAMKVLEKRILKEKNYFHYI